MVDGGSVVSDGRVAGWKCRSAEVPKWSRPWFIGLNLGSILDSRFSILGPGLELGLHAAGGW